LICSSVEQCESSVVCSSVAQTLTSYIWNYHQIIILEEAIINKALSQILSGNTQLANFVLNLDVHISR